MTVIEKQYMDAVIQINRRQRDNEPDWEQRRYEIAKDTAVALFGAIANGAIHKGAMFDPNYPSIAKTSVSFANVLVDELKKTQEKK